MPFCALQIINCYYCCYHYYIITHIFMAQKQLTTSQKSLDNSIRKIVVLAKLLLCEMSSSTVNNMRSHQALRNINHFIGGHNLFQTKRTYLLNKGEKSPFRKIVVLAKLRLCERSSTTANKMRGAQNL